MRDERECPHCAEMVLVRAKVCKHCSRDIDPVNNVTDPTDPRSTVADDTREATASDPNAPTHSRRASRPIVLVGLLAALSISGAYAFLHSRNAKPECDSPPVLDLVRQIHSEQWAKDGAIARAKYVKGEISAEDRLTMLAENPVLYASMMQLRMAAQMMENSDSAKAREDIRGAAFDAAMNGISFDYSDFMTEETDSKAETSCKAFVHVMARGTALADESFTYRVRRTDDHKTLVGSAKAVSFFNPIGMLKKISSPDAAIQRLKSISQSLYLLQEAYFADHNYRFAESLTQLQAASGERPWNNVTVVLFDVTRVGWKARVSMDGTEFSCTVISDYAVRDRIARSYSVTKADSLLPICSGSAQANPKPLEEQTIEAFIQNCDYAGIPEPWTAPNLKIPFGGMTLRNVRLDAQGDLRLSVEFVFEGNPSAADNTRLHSLWGSGGSAGFPVRRFSRWATDIRTQNVNSKEAAEMNVETNDNRVVVSCAVTRTEK